MCVFRFIIAQYGRNEATIPMCILFLMHNSKFIYVSLKLKKLYFKKLCLVILSKRNPWYDYFFPILIGVIAPLRYQQQLQVCLLLHSSVIIGTIDPLSSYVGRVWWGRRYGVRVVARVRVGRSTRVG